MTQIRENELNTGSQHKCEISGEGPMVFAAGLSDKELAGFLENLAIQLRARLKAASKPALFLEEAKKAEAELIELNKAIGLVVYQQKQAPIQRNQIREPLLSQAADQDN